MQKWVKIELNYRKKFIFITEKLSNDVSRFTDSESIDLYDTEPFGSDFNLFFIDCFLLATDALFESAFFCEQNFIENHLIAI